MSACKFGNLCRFKICRDCYLDATKDGGLCPGCREPYKIEEDDAQDLTFGALPLPAPGGATNNVGHGMTLMKRSQPGEFDHNRFLFETKGTYGVGNAYSLKKEDAYGGGDEKGFGDKAKEKTMEKPWKPLTRKINVPTSILSPYRYQSIHIFSSFF